MNDSFRNYFQSQIDEEVDFGPVMRFSIKRNDKSISHFIFVEGSTDEQFYGNTRIDTLRNRAAYFYRKVKDEDSLPEYKGKEAVFYSLKRVCQNDQLSSEIDRCVFIVDRDFSDHISSSRVKLSASEYKRVLVTLGHSMENYFLEKNNVTILLQHFGIDPIRFWNLFSDFAGAMSPYYALNAVITENYQKIRYRKKYTNAEILSFDFSKGENYWDGYDAMCEECQLIRAKLRQNPAFLQRASFLESKIRSNPRYIRGHDAYSFLEEYLKQLFELQIGFSFYTFDTIKPIIASFDVELMHK